MDDKIINNGELVSTGPMGMTLIRKPREILAEATEAAKALAEVIKNKPKPVIFNGEQYLEFEDWQTCARFYGLTVKIVWTRPIEIGGAMGFEAGAEVIDNRSGMVVSAAEAMCLNDEEKWSKRTKYEWEGKKRIKVGEVAVPMFQLRSMAQTRAGAKALRNVLAWVVVLAGFKPNVAEELTGDESGLQPNPKANVKPPEKKQGAGAATTATAQTEQREPGQDNEPTAGELDVFQKLELTLRRYCGGEEQVMRDLLKELTVFVGSKDGKEHYKLTVDQFARDEKGAKWAGQTLRKLEDKIKKEQGA